MTMSAYNELYLNDAMQNLGDMIQYAVCELKFNPDIFFEWFIASGVASQFEKGNPKYIAGMSGYELAEEVLKTTNVNYERKEPKYSIDLSKEYWAGWILAYYQWETNQRFEDIVYNGLTLSIVISMYILHEADISKFVESANEIISRNKMNRKTKLQQIRKARGFSQRELSEVSGVTLRMIQLYEQRQNDISKAQVNIVIRLAKALGCKVEDLID